MTYLPLSFSRLLFQSAAPRECNSMVAESQDGKLPPALAYPFIAVSILLAVIALIDITHRVRWALITFLTIIFGVCETGLATAVYLLLKRNATRAGKSYRDDFCSIVDKTHC
jgi:hypothetical protein